MRVLIIGGGPGGLYSGLLLKKWNPGFDITVVDRNPPDATYGWGIVFSEQTLNSFRDADPESYEEITRNFVEWTAIEVHYRGMAVRCGGHHFAGASRKVFLQILQQRCEQVGVRLCYRTEIRKPEEWSDYDLVIGADGLASVVRKAYSDHFQPVISAASEKYIWLGSNLVLTAFTFWFAENEHGVFQTHSYPFSKDLSTVIVECDQAAWRRAGLDRASESESVAYCERLFADKLAGHQLLSNRSSWLSFETIKNKSWHYRNAVLLGDSAHTAHFSVGSGTKMAMEDAIALARACTKHRELEAALTDYELERRPYVEGIQRAAQQSRIFFENTRHYFHMAPLQFTFHLLTRSGRITRENMRVRDPGFVEGVDSWFASQANANRGIRVDTGAAAVPPALNPLRLRHLTLANRLVHWPVALDAAEDGSPGLAHQEVLSNRNLGGVAAGLVMTEVCSVSSDGRITPGSCGLYQPEHVAAWQVIVDRLHRDGAHIGVTLSHAGRRGSTRPRSEGLDRPLRAGNWPLLSASPLPYTTHSAVPREMDTEDLKRVLEDFVAAARSAAWAGFDAMLLHCAHGYLLASFLSPVSNRRTDCNGGSLENRMRYPLAVFQAVRAVWPTSKPLLAAIPATDFAKGGWEADDAVALAQRLKELGCDAVAVMTGQATPEAEPSYGPGFLNSVCDFVSNQVGIPVMSSGYIADLDIANTAVAAGRADLCIIERVP